MTSTTQQHIVLLPMQHLYVVDLLHLLQMALIVKDHQLAWHEIT